MSTTAHVTVTDKLRDLGAGKPRRWQVRWKVDGCPEKTAAFPTKQAAKAHQARLIAAVSSGELFDRGTREPVSWGTADRGPNLPEWTRAWMAAHWNTWQPSVRRSALEGVAAWLPALGTRDVADREVVYSMLKTVLNPGATPTREQTDLWRRLVSAGRPAGSIGREHMTAAVAACRTKLDGGKAAATYGNRRRALLGQVLNELVAADLLDRNPLDGYRESKAMKADAKVDPAEVGEAGQVMRVLTHLRGRSEKWSVLFALMYFAGLRPSEAVAVRWRDLVDLPAVGWGTLRLRKAAADAGKGYTDNGEARQETGLKWREADAVRVVPLPPALVATLREFMPATVDRDILVCPGQGGKPVSSTTVQREWKAARNAVLDGEVDRQCLHRPYSLRHSAASLWLGLGVGPADVASRLGHSVEMLLSTYADVLDSHREQANVRIGDALEEAAAALEVPDVAEDPAVELERLRARLAELEGAAR